MTAEAICAGVSDAPSPWIRTGSVFRPRSSNRTCGSPASGFPTGFTRRLSLVSRAASIADGALSGGRRTRSPAATACPAEAHRVSCFAFAQSSFGCVRRCLEVERLSPIPQSQHLPRRPRSRAPSLRRHYPASTVLRAPPTSVRADPRRAVAGCDPAPRRISHVATSSFVSCRSHYPGGTPRMQATVASPGRDGLPQVSGGSASATELSRPARDSHALRPETLPTTHHGRPSQGFGVSGHPLPPPAGYRVEPSIARTGLPPAG